MKNTFRGYYSLDEKELKKLWKDAIFIFDTNVLLNLYRYKPKTKDQLISVMEKLSNRVWIPYQVGLEYQRNRIFVISDQRKKFHDAKSILERLPSYLETSFSDKGIKKRHSHIDDDAFTKEINTVVVKFQKKLELQEKDILTETSEDKIRSKLDEIFSKYIGLKPKTQEWLDELYSEGEKRYEQSIPPGYKDNKKEEDSYSYGGLTYKNKFGDFVLWRQIIDHAKEKKIKDIVFITDDGKSDWWYEVGGKTIGVRPELIEEIKDKAGVMRFYAYSTDKFLNHSKEHIKAKIDKEVIEDAKETRIRRMNMLTRHKKHFPHEAYMPSDSMQERHEKHVNQSMRAEYAVSNWIKTQFESDVERNNGFPDFVVQQNEKKYGYEVKYIKNSKQIRRDLDEIMSRADYVRYEMGFDNINIVFVVNDDDIIENLVHIISRTKDKWQSDCSVIVGVLNSKDNEPSFVPLMEI